MTEKKKTQKPMVEPTNAEMEILQVLWDNGPSTVRFVNDTLNKEKREVNYTSTLKQMQVMTEKGLLTRDESSMKHVYSPVYEEEMVKNHFLQKFVDVYYKGSASKLVMQLLGNKKTSKKDLEYIKEQIKKLD